MKESAYNLGYNLGVSKEEKVSKMNSLSNANNPHTMTESSKNLNGLYTEYRGYTYAID